LSIVRRAHSHAYIDSVALLAALKRNDVLGYKQAFLLLSEMHKCLDMHVVDSDTEDSGEEGKAWMGCCYNAAEVTFIAN